jgi:diacylglycerol kinase family enzyme
LNKENFNLKKIVQSNFATHILIVGGDGTVRIICENILNNEIDINVAIYPIGSTNVMAKILGVTRNLKYIKHPKIKEVYPSIVNSKYYFFLAFCLGTIADVTIEAEKLHKNRIGFLAYIISAILHFRKENNFSFKESVPKHFKWKGQSLHFFTNIFVTKFLNNLCEKKIGNYFSKNTLIIRYLKTGLFGYIKLWNRILKGDLRSDEFYLSDEFVFEKSNDINIYLDGDEIKVNENKIYITKSKSSIRFIC